MSEDFNSEIIICDALSGIKYPTIARHFFKVTVCSLTPPHFRNNLRLTFHSENQLLLKGAKAETLLYLTF